ncbi:MAG TPA: glycosyltransferase [Anaerolineae bacterium]
MRSNSLVSVIIIFLNAEQFLEEAIESIFAQSYGNWELLLVNDGSTDGSTAIACEYARQYPGKVCYLEHEEQQNRGMSASRNLGIRHARGEYVAFLDSDDVWLPHKLAQQVAILDTRPEAAMVYGPTQWWYSWTGKPEDSGRDFVLEAGVPANTLIQPPLLLARFLQMESISPCTCSVLLRREVVERVNGFEESFRGLYEDQAFFAKLCLAAPILVTDECVARYRQHTNSGSSIARKTGQRRAARLTFLKWLERYLSRKGVEDGEVWQALRRELWPYQHPFLYRLRRRLGQSRPGQIASRLRNMRLRWTSLPFIRHLRCLQLRRLRPLGNGRQRGTAVVRFYWERYLQKHQADIHGICLEVGTTATVRQYGGEALARADAIDLAAHSPEVTVVADLSRADHLPDNTYDCFVNQFTMHLIYDVEAALYHAIRILKPGGVLLVNFPCVDYYFASGLDMGTGSPLFLYWWFTPIQVENLLRRAGLDGADYTLDIYGNLFARIAYQMNMPAEELTQRELEYSDPGHPLLICVRVVKPDDWRAKMPVYRDPWRPDTAPAQWNPVTGHYAA